MTLAPNTPTAKQAGDALTPPRVSVQGKLVPVRGPRPLLIIVLLLACSPALYATTWYVRADGGSRYSATALKGQCDGLADAAYPGKGIDRHCAFNDYRFLWDDRSYGHTGWVISGGDIVILDNTKQWRVGFDGNGPSDALVLWRRRSLRLRQSADPGRHSRPAHPHPGSQL